MYIHILKKKKSNFVPSYKIEIFQSDEQLFDYSGINFFLKVRY